MKEIDFLPEWYKESKRRRTHVRRQYVALAGVFLVMMTYNLAATHQSARATAELARLEGKRIEAESILHEFNVVTKAFDAVKTKADLIERIDSRIDVGAVLAEISHLIEDTLVLSRVEFTAEALGNKQNDRNDDISGVRVGGRGTAASGELRLGDVRFRVLLVGLAASPSNVAALVRRLEDSLYFHQVNTSWRDSQVHVSAKTIGTTPKSQTGGAAAERTETIDATEFEISCYLANYEEIDE